MVGSDPCLGVQPPLAETGWCQRRRMPPAFENFSAKEWRDRLKDESFDVLKTNRYGQLQRRKVQKQQM